MARMSHRQVEAFRAVMLAGGMTRAAALLGITQPAVSRLVQDFERATGLALFERRGNLLAPTPDARALAAEVERSFVGLDRIGAFARAVRGRTAGTLAIAALPAIATELLPRFVGRFAADRPGLRVTLEGLTSPAVVEAVAGGRCDFGYASGAVGRPGLEADVVPALAVAALPEGHPLLARAVIGPGDLAGQRLVGGARNLFQNGLDAALAGIEAAVPVETPMSHAACALVASGAGIAILDPFTVGGFLGRGVATRPFRPALRVDLCLFRRRDAGATPLAALFVAAFRAHLDAVAAAMDPAVADLRGPSQAR